MIVFDTSFIVLSFDKNAPIPIDPNTGLPLEKCKERIDHLIQSLTATKQRILIPTPVISEYLVKAGPDKDLRLQEFLESRAFVVAPFDLRAAIECSIIQDGESGRTKPLTEIESKAKVKFDRQIIAIAKARSAATIYTGDIGLCARAIQNGLNGILTWEVPLPPPDVQMKLEYEEPKAV